MGNFAIGQQLPVGVAVEFSAVIDEATGAS
jgi:hypothetical protein